MFAQVLVASGFSKWGFTAGTAAAELLSTHAANEQAPVWGDAWKPRLISDPSSALTVALTNAHVGTELARGWASASVSSRSPESVGDGDGVVSRDGVTPVATSRVDGTLHRRSAVCPHLGGIVSWNDAERSWDCPLHGSRFGPDGTPLCAPAVSGLGDA
jgi:nitrite reductase/ring-hydroxylating ferredoxin subunit